MGCFDINLPFLQTATELGRKTFWEIHFFFNIIYFMLAHDKMFVHIPIWIFIYYLWFWDLFINLIMSIQFTIWFKYKFFAYFPFIEECLWQLLIVSFHLFWSYRVKKKLSLRCFAGVQIPCYNLMFFFSSKDIDDIPFKLLTSFSICICREYWDDFSAHNEIHVFILFKINACEISYCRTAIKNRKKE